MLEGNVLNGRGSHRMAPKTVTASYLPRPFVRVILSNQRSGIASGKPTGELELKFLEQSSNRVWMIAGTKIIN